MHDIVQFGGGRGTRTIIRAILARRHSRLTTVVNAYDDGRSTGEIRRIFRMLGPSDIRKNQAEMLPPEDPEFEDYSRLFACRLPAGADHDETVAEFDDFARGDRDEIAGCSFSSAETRGIFRRLARSFTRSLSRYETVHRDRLDFSDCSLMNCFYAGAFESFGRNFAATTVFFDKLLRNRGTVLPTSLEDLKLVAIRESGEVLYREAEIVESASDVPIREVFLRAEYPDRGLLDSLPPDERYEYLRATRSKARATTEVVHALGSADVILFGPGTPHSSIYPSLLATGVPEAIARNRRALKVFVANLHEDRDVPGCSAADLLRGALGYLEAGSSHPVAAGDLVDVVLVNDPGSRPSPGSVRPDPEGLEAIGASVVLDEFADPADPERHDGRKVLETVSDEFEKAVRRRVR